MGVEDQILQLERDLLTLVDGPQRSLRLVDPETGFQEDRGVIIHKRLVDDLTVWLTYSKVNRLWWIIWQDDRLRMLGFRDTRRKDCWRTYFELDKAEMLLLRQAPIT